MNQPDTEHTQSKLKSYYKAVIEFAKDRFESSDE